MNHSIKPFTLLIKPVSGDCNLRCGYCFYLKVPGTVYPGTGVHRMDARTLEMLTLRYLNFRFPESSFAWQGGEPTLAGLEFFKQATRLQRKHGADGQSVSNGFQTNGLLIDADWAGLFKRYNFLIGLSLDGPEDIHNHYRAKAGGQGTHSDVIRALRLLQRWEVEVNILCVVSKANVGKGRELCEYFRGLGMSHVQFIPAVEKDPETGKPSEFTPSPEEFGDFLCETFDYWMEGEPWKFSIRDFDSILTAYLDDPRHMCIHSSRCDTYFLIEHNGDVYPCDFFCDPSRLLGNVNSNSFDEIQGSELYKTFADMKKDLPEECRTCRWIKPCWGGCTKDRLNIFGEWKTKSYFCEAYKSLLPHAQQGLRMLKEMIEDVVNASAPKPGAQTPRLEEPTKEKKQGRNDLCSCGSGKKYKNCCMR